MAPETIQVVAILGGLIVANTLYTRWLIKWHRRMVYLDVMEFLIRQGREEEPELPSLPPVPPPKPSNRDHLRLIS